MIPYPGAALRQKLSVDRQHGGCFILKEGLAAGRIGAREGWRFRQMSRKITIKFDVSRQFFARSSLLPASYPLERAGRMEESGYLGSIIASRLEVAPTANDVTADEDLSANVSQVGPGNVGIQGSDRIEPLKGIR